MALIGNCTHFTYSVHETDTTTETITNPDGTVETVEVPVIVVNSVDYSNVYLCITKIDHLNKWYENHSSKVILYQYAAFVDKETRNSNDGDFLFAGDSHLIDYDHESNLYEQIYNDIKEIEGFQNLTKD